MQKGATVHSNAKSTADSVSESAGHSTITFDSLVYGVRPENTQKVLAVMKQVTGALQASSIVPMLYNSAVAADVAYKLACR